MSENKKGIFSWYFNTSLLLRIFIGLVLGAIVGLIAGPAISWINPAGKIFVNLLKMIVMPVVLSSLIVGAASINPSVLGKVGVKILIFYLLTSAFAVAVGLILGNLLNVGAGLELSTSTEAVGKVLTKPKLGDTLINIIPKNPFEAIARGEVLPIIFFAIVFGIGISHLKTSENQRLKQIGTTLFEVFEGTAEVMYLVVRGILEYAPIGVFALIAVVFANQGSRVIGALGVVTATAYLGYILHILLIYGGLLLLGKIAPIRFFSQARTTLVTAFVTRSSSGTLPVTIQASDRMGVDRRISSFTLPLGATINMDGTAIYQGVCVIFIGMAIGMPLSIGQQLTVIITAVLASVGTAGVPGAGAIMLLMVLNSVGLPVEAGTPVAAAYAMILGIDALLDMGRTMVNVSGDLTGTLLVAKSEKAVDLSKWN